MTAASSLQGQAGPPAEQQKRVHAAVFEAASRGVRATARAGSPRPGRSLDARTGCVEVKHHQALALEVLPQLARSRVAPRCGASERCVRSP